MRTQVDTTDAGLVAERVALLRAHVRYLTQACHPRDHAHPDLRDPLIQSSQVIVVIHDFRFERSISLHVPILEA